MSIVMYILIGLVKFMTNANLVGIVSHLVEILIIWKTKKQCVVVRSNAEAECRSMAKSTTEVVWLNQLLRELGFQVNVPKLVCQ